MLRLREMTSGAIIGAAVGLAMGSVLVAAAATWDQEGPRTTDGCAYKGISEISVYEHGDAWSSSDGSGAYCFGYGSFHVHAYFWGSDYQYHYVEDNNGILANASWDWWTDDIYGYSTWKSTLPYLETHAHS